MVTNSEGAPLSASHGHAPREAQWPGPDSAVPGLRERVRQGQGVRDTLWQRRAFLSHTPPMWGSAAMGSDPLRHSAENHGPTCNPTLGGRGRGAERAGRGGRGWPEAQGHPRGRSQAPSRRAGPSEGPSNTRVKPGVRDLFPQMSDKLSFPLKVQFPGPFSLTSPGQRGRYLLEALAQVALVLRVTELQDVLSQQVLQREGFGHPQPCLHNSHVNTAFIPRFAPCSR